MMAILLSCLSKPGCCLEQDSFESSFSILLNYRKVQQVFNIKTSFILVLQTNRNCIH